MKQPKWTPGPWGNVIHGERESRVGANTLLAIVYSTAFRDQENQMANAHLIAAAPDLYAALEAVEEWWLTDMMHKMDGAPACIFMARAALAKARGESDAGQQRSIRKP